MEQPDTKPLWQQISSESFSAKAYWNEWDGLTIKNECLYRKWESNSGQVIRNQLILPYIYHDNVMRQLHDAKTSGHVGRKTNSTQDTRAVFLV